MKFRFLDKFGSIGAILAAMTCVGCFPFLAVIGSAIGLGALAKYEGIALQLMKPLVLIALIGNILAYRHHKKIVPLILGVVSPLMILYAFYIMFRSAIIYIGLLGLLITAILNFIESKKCDTCNIDLPKNQK